jgi:hypothetical protein
LLKNFITLFINSLRRFFRKRRSLEFYPRLRSGVHHWRETPTKEYQLTQTNLPETAPPCAALRVRRMECPASQPAQSGASGKGATKPIFFVPPPLTLIGEKKYPRNRRFFKPAILIFYTFILLHKNLFWDNLVSRRSKLRSYRSRACPSIVI